MKLNGKTGENDENICNAEITQKVGGDPTWWVGEGSISGGLLTLIWGEPLSEVGFLQTNRILMNNEICKCW